MLNRLKVTGFKSLSSLSLRLPRLTVLFGPNTAGKSNLVDALSVLSRLATERTLADALEGPIRGYPIEMFTFPPGGLADLLDERRAEFTIEADLTTRAIDRRRAKLRYKATIAIDPKSGRLSNSDEYLGRLAPSGRPVSKAPIEVVNERFHIRRKSQGRPREESLGINHTIVSDLRLNAPEYTWIERARRELSAFRTYYLDPRVAMRRAAPPKEVIDIGPLGDDLAPFLYGLRTSHPKHFSAAARTLRNIIPSVESLGVELDTKRGTLDIQVRQNGVQFSSRIISEGTLRVLALAAIAVNPWPASLIAFEEPENGVHPRRLELVARLLASLALIRGQQVVVTTHSPLFCQEILEIKRENPDAVGLIVIRQDGGQTKCVDFSADGPLFEDKKLRKALTSREEDGLFEGLVLRGLIDG